MGKPRQFTTLPVRAISEPALTALDIRCLAVISLHDGMSGMRGNGGGCYARNDTLARLVGTDPTNFSKCVSKLVRLGYVLREPQLMDKRRFTLRVAFDGAETWRDEQLSRAHPQGEIVGEPTNDLPEIVGDMTNYPPEIVGEAATDFGGFSSETDQHYISLNEELDSVETGELNSPKGRDFANRKIRGASLMASPFGKRDTPEGGQAGWSLRALMPRNFDTLPSGAQVAKIETAFASVGRDPSGMLEAEREEIGSLLWAVSEAFPDEPQGQQAQRLHEEMAYY